MDDNVSSLGRAKSLGHERPLGRGNSLARET